MRALTCDVGVTAFFVFFFVIFFLLGAFTTPSPWNVFLPTETRPLTVVSNLPISREMDAVPDRIPGTVTGDAEPCFSPQELPTQGAES